TTPPACGAPWRWSGLAASGTASAGGLETNEDGPVPTGWLPKAWPEATSSDGRIAPQPEARVARSAGAGWLRCTTTVRSSTASTDVMAANSLAFGDAVSGLRMRSRLATTSAASRVVPSWNVASTRWNVYESESSPTSYDSARAGTISPDWSTSTSVS